MSFNALRDHVLPHLNDIMVNLPQDQYDRIQRLQVGFFYPDGQLIGSVRHEDQDTLDSLRPRPPLKNEADFSARDRLRDL
ncbi:hypothetical protein [Lentzea sp. E54]|uniref:hypothetical protein n=1 Tax=Lentzea xerophila TaxID=3435883 RepID=UPI003DA22990